MPQYLKTRLRDAAVILGIAAMLTFFGVYDHDSPVWVRFLMWVVTCAVGITTAEFVAPAVFVREIVGKLVPVKVAITAAIISVPVLLSLYLYMGLFGTWVPMHLLPMQYVYVFAMSLVLTLTGFLIGKASRSSAAADRPAASDAVQHFLDRLPVRFRQAELWAISSEDHYLRVHTNLGEELILMRLADAVRELEGAAGGQVHRSWWVAKAGVSDARRENGKLVLVLKNGTDVPVSRTYQAAAKEAGLA
ncbi:MULTISPECIES: LytTR family DNA-binding domain-containing protein [Hyphomonas]|nr:MULTISPECIES: LytTR family DNA-binding domain-containing protein [Hyphomonas]|tara:strand:+ start:24095 stop:24838 length:744 start_codon:yes stop_codon:yes gene_type:complete